MTKKPKPKAEARDIAVLHGPTEDGKGARLLRFRGDTVTAGEIRPAREGQPLGQAELVRLKPLHRELPVCEVEVLHAPNASEATPSEAATPPTSEAETDADSPSAPTRTGPARVSTQRYRRNWSAVFGEKPERPRGRRGGPDYSVN